MKKYFKEIIIILIQIFEFYLLPLFTAPTDMLGLIIWLTIMVFILALIIGLINSKIKYIYPFIIAILFTFTIFIYYNESACIYIIGYLIIAYIGVIIGLLIHKLFKKKNYNL